MTSDQKASRARSDASLAEDPLGDRLKRVLRYLPAPVGIVTSFDPENGDPVGLAMSAMMPVSLAPCSMAIAVNRSGSSYDAIVRSGLFCINLLDSNCKTHMVPFAQRESRNLRFTQTDWLRDGQVCYIKGAPANIFCKTRTALSFGTHDLLVGEVYNLISSGAENILGWANGMLGRLVSVQEFR